MSSQLHKRLNEYQVKDILQKYLNKVMEAKDAYRYLELGRTRFYELVEEFKKDPHNFTLGYRRHRANNKIKEEIKLNILNELKFEKEKIIDNPIVPTKRYNYSYIRNLLEEKYKQKTALSTIIALAKNNGYYKPKVKNKNKHDRQVITNFIGELIQHDSSHHLFAPDARLKWYLITSLDDYSRRILYGDFVAVETTWTHIEAVQYLCLTFGIPLAYYADQHRIFRYVKSRDVQTVWTHYRKFTDDVNPQWRQVLKDLSIIPKNALSPQAKGKVEKPYGWLQDHIVRNCVRLGVKDIEEARKILKEELYLYNNKWIHSTTGEIPIIRFNKAVQTGKTLFRPFEIPKPFESVKDIFSIRTERITDGYRTVSLEGTKLKVPKGECYVHVELRMYPNVQDKTVEVRFWQDKIYLGSITASLDKIPIVRF